MRQGLFPTIGTVIRKLHESTLPSQLRIRPITNTVRLMHCSGKPFVERPIAGQ